MSYCLYIIESIKFKHYYVGSSQDPIQRLTQHNSGKVKSTKAYRPYKIVFKQRFSTIKEAQRAEKNIKKWKRKDFIDKIVKNQKYYLGS